MSARKVLAILGAVSLTLISSHALARNWGAKLSSTVQPSNAGKGHFCEADPDETKPNCTWVLMQAYKCESGSCTDGHLAPKDGTIKHIKLIACYKGSFTLQIARVNSGQTKAKVVHSGPHIAYLGDSQHCAGTTFDVESFPVNVEVKKGDYLAVEAKKVGFLRCDSGGPRIFEFAPPLPDGGPFTKPGEKDGCFMLLEATYN